MIARILDWVKIHQRDFLLAFCMVLVAWSSFNIGRIISSRTEPVSITQKGVGIPASAIPERSEPLDVRVVVSRNSSSKKYHYSWCGSGKRIKAENQVWFETAALAEAAGYSLAGNCR